MFNITESVLILNPEVQSKFLWLAMGLAFDKMFKDFTRFSNCLCDFETIWNSTPKLVWKYCVQTEFDIGCTACSKTVAYPLSQQTLHRNHDSDFYYEMHITCCCVKFSSSFTAIGFQKNIGENEIACILMSCQIFIQDSSFLLKY